MNEEGYCQNDVAFLFTLSALVEVLKVDHARCSMIGFQFCISDRSNYSVNKILEVAVNGFIVTFPTIIHLGSTSKPRYSHALALWRPDTMREMMQLPVFWWRCY